MNNTLRLRLDDVTERWGVKVTNVEVWSALGLVETRPLGTGLQSFDV
jgi:hypothetical protein